MQTFLDVPPSHPFYGEITWTAQAGLLRGWSSGHFRPGWKITRGAMAAVLYRLSGLPYYQPPAASVFRDVATTYDFYPEIHWVKQRGLLRGWADGAFRPESHITREATAALFFRAAGSPAYTAPSTPRFTDVPPGAAFYREIHWMAEQKITTGWSDGTFRPLSTTIRADMSAFLHRFDRAV